MLNLGLIDLLNLVYTEAADPEKAKADAAKEAEAAKLAEAEAAEAEEAEKAKLDEEQMVPITDLRKIRAEAATYRKKLRALEEKVDASTKAQEKADSDAEISKLEGLDQEKARTEQVTKELAEANTALAEKDATIKSQAIGAAAYSAANAVGFHKPEQAALLLDLSGLDIVDGVVDEEEINDLVNTLAESSPHLLKGDTDDDNNVGPTNPANQRSGPRVKLTDQDSIAKLKQQSKAAQQEGNMTSAVSLMNKAWELEHGIKSG